MRKLGRILFVIFTFPAILYCDGWKLTLTGALAFIRGDHFAGPPGYDADGSTKKGQK